MEKWKEYKLGDLYDVHNGLSKGGKFFGSGYPFLSFSTVFNNYFLPNELTSLVQSSEKEQANFNIKEGDVFITRTSESADELGMSSVALKDYPNATYNGFTKRLRPKGVIEISSKYIGYYLRSPKFRTNFYKLTSAMSTRASLANNDLLNMIVSIPSLQTQQKIAKILSSLDDKIEVNRRINEQLEELAQALFKSWFVDFEPFKDGEFVESELGMIPEGWKVGKFTDIIDIKGGGTPKTDIAEYWNGDIPFFTPKDINDVFCISTEKNITDLGLSKCSSKLYSKNTVFITARGTVGKVCMAGRDMAMNQTCYALIGKKNYGQHFIYMQTISIVERMKKKANGAVFSAITTRDFDSEKIIIPSLDIVSDYLMKIEPLYESILHNQQEINHLTNLRDTLLPKLMSGEIDVEQFNVIE